MKQKLPKSIKGPFVLAHYNKNKSRIYLKKTTGETTIIDDVYPTMFIPKPQIQNFPGDEFEEYIVSIKDDERYYRVELDPWIKRDVIDDILTTSYANHAYPREADVDPIRRWFSDTGALVSNETKALFFDLETHPLADGFDDDAKKQHRIISFSAWDQNGKKWFVAAEESSPEQEAQVINKFLDIAEAYDTLLAWNGNYYDFFVLRHRCIELEIHVDWYQWNLLDYMEVVKKCLMSISDPTFKRSFALDNIGQNVLGMRKIKTSVPVNKLSTLLGDKVGELQEYNDRDVEIMIKLEEAREFLKLHLAVCSICRMFPGPNSLYPNSLADGLMLRLAVKENRHFKSRFKNVEDIPDKKFPGAFVMDAILGYHENVQVIDFASLYPSIMISWNMSPDTKLSTGFTSTRQIATATATGVRFRTDRIGMLPLALKRLMTQRKVYSKKQKLAEVGTDKWKQYGHESTALKVVANSMYGLLGSPYSRYYDRDIAESVTQSGQLLIKACIRYCGDRGYKVVAGDTDSCFVKASVRDTQNLVEEINTELIPQILNDSGCIEVAVKMDSDKGYSHLLIQAKKKYAGRLSTHKGRPAPPDMEPDVKGLEFQRSDQIRFAQRMQMYFLPLLLDPKSNPDLIESEIRNWANKFMYEDIPRSDIEITQGISKHPKKYDSPGPAVKVAKQMIANGKEFYVGMKVPYIIISSKDGLKAIHGDDYNGHFDRLYYWKNKVLPLITRLTDVRFPDHQFYDLESMAKDPRQGLFDFKTSEENLPVKKVKKKKVKKPIAKIIIPEKGGTNTVKGIKKLIDNSKTDDYKVKVVIELKEATVNISTKEYVDMNSLKEIKKLFPWVKITPKPI